MSDGTLWAAFGLLGTLLVVGMLTQLKVLLDIKVELSKSSRRRRSPDE